MKSVLISIRPKWCEKIASGEKTIEVRKSAPSEVPFKCYIYMSQGDLKDLGSYSEWIYKNRMKVIGEFICDKVYNIEPIFSFYGCYSGYDDTSDCSYFEGYSIDDERLEETCLTQQDLCIYGNGNRLYGWHISDLKIYDKPKKLSEFISSKPKNKFRAHGDNLTRPPQSWIYVEEQNE